MLQEFKKSKDWQEVKELLEECIAEEKEKIVVRNTDDKIVGQEYRAIRSARTIVKAIIRKVEGQMDIKEKPTRLI